MTREMIDLEFLGAEYDCGYAAGTQDTDLTEAAVQLARDIERAMTAEESLTFACGWYAGQADRAAYLADMASMTPPWFTCEEVIPY